MHILLISACEKRAIKKTNAILDSYAVRVGDRTWATPITTESLAELHAALRRVATRQTAVACFQNDGRRRMKLLWIVGSRSAFGPDGQISVGTTRAKRVHHLAPTPLWTRCVCLLAQAAALVHDWGKYSQYFQDKLRSNARLRDEIRHEWLSVLVVQRMRDEQSWEKAWSFSVDSVHSLVLGQRCFPSGINYGPACAQEAIDYLIATHHLLFADAISSFSDTRNSILATAAPCVKHSHVRFEKGKSPTPLLLAPHSPLASGLFEEYAKLERKLATLTQAYQGIEHTQFWWGAMVYARAALIFADHTVSAIVKEQGVSPDDACANTCTDANSARRLNQGLAWHLRTVAAVAAQTAWHMTQLCQQSVGRSSSLGGLQDHALSEILAPADEHSRFQWQNAAAGTLASMREQHPDLPCLVFNMAGTGSGKTRMNIRAACILSRSATPRCSIALNLRSLTLQTGDALRSSLNLSASDLATLIGDHTSQKLFNKSNVLFVDDDENMLEPDIMCSGERAPLPAWMESFFRTPQERALMGVPLLVSTIDFLGAAGSPQAQGHHVKALFRLMSADLVLDEIDGYEPEALVAVLRLVQLCALFQRNVICSSATLSEPTAVAIDAAYRSGVSMRCSLEGDTADPHFIRAIIDDALSPHADKYSGEDASFQAVYTQRLGQLAQHLRDAPCLRLAYLQKVEESRDGFKQAIHQAVCQLHASTKALYGGAGVSHKDCRISVGLVRVATIAGAIDVARYLARTLPHAHIACYHSGDWRISRFYKERRLDYLLSRKHGDSHIWQDGDIARLVANAADVPFIVVATPVEEIGRDHDFDWAVIEPSSAQSIVQTAGRVNRHRLIPVQGCNIALLQYNLRHCSNIDDGNDGHIAFTKPGYEQAHNRSAYADHDVQKLLPWPSGQQPLVINAALRFDPACKLARADDAAIQRRTAVYFGTTPEHGAGMFVRNPQYSVLMSATPYQDTPLRDPSTPKELWRMHVGDGGLSYSRLETVQGQADRFIKHQWVSNNTEMTSMGAAPNAWLNLTPDAMLNLCYTMDISAEEGLQAELNTYGKESTFEHDLAFGIRRLK